MLKTIEDFRDIHRGETCIVCARGPSMTEEINNPLLKKVTTIGINHIEEDGFDTTYVLTANAYTVERAKKYLPGLYNTKAKHLFAYHDIPSPKQIRYKIEGIGLDGPNDIGELQNKDTMFSYKSSTMPGISLALYMGFKTIGILGFDLSLDHPMSRILESMEIACQQVLIYCQEQKIKIYNIGKKSRIISFPKCDIYDFLVRTSHTFRRQEFLRELGS